METKRFAKFCRNVPALRHCILVLRFALTSLQPNLFCKCVPLHSWCFSRRRMQRFKVLLNCYSTALLEIRSTLFWHCLQESSNYSNPFLARAYSTIFECARFLKRNHDARSTWAERLYRDNTMLAPSCYMVRKHVLSSQFSIERNYWLYRSCFGAASFNFAAVELKYVCYLLRHFGAHWCYQG